MFPEEETGFLLVEVQEGQTEALSALFRLLTQVGHSEEDIATVRQLVTSEDLVHAFPMTMPWVLLHITVNPSQRQKHSLIARLGKALGVPERQPPYLLATLANMPSAASGRIPQFTFRPSGQPGSRPFPGRPVSRSRKSWNTSQH